MNYSADWTTVEKYLEDDMPFAALALFPGLLATDSSVHRKLKYADTLRLCGYFRESLECFTSIYQGGISGTGRYYYHLLLARLYMDTGENEKAIEELIHCVASPDADTVPFIYLSSLLSTKQKYTDCVALLQQALEREGDIDEVWYNIAGAYANLGQFSKALDAIEKCIALDSGYPNAVTMRSDITERIRLNKELDLRKQN